MITNSNSSTYFAARRAEMSIDTWGCALTAILVAESFPYVGLAALVGACYLLYKQYRIRQYENAINKILLEAIEEIAKEQNDEDV